MNFGEAMMTPVEARVAASQSGMIAMILMDWWWLMDDVTLGAEEEEVINDIDSEIRFRMNWRWNREREKQRDEKAMRDAIFSRHFT